MNTKLYQITIIAIILWAIQNNHLRGSGKEENPCGSGIFIGKKEQSMQTTSFTGNTNDNGQKDSSSQNLFQAFLKRHGARVGFITQDSVDRNRLIKGLPSDTKLTEFVTLHDSLMYSQMIEKLLSFVSPHDVNLMIDLGAGSSVPVLRALKKRTEHDQLKVLAIDIDPKAIEISRHNVYLMNLDSRYSFQEIDMISFIQGRSIQPGTIIVSNPPYMPIPQELTKDPFYLPVNGGPDGTKYLESILMKEMPSGTAVGLRWCSLSNPNKMIDLIEKKYDVLFIDAHTAPFGTYARKTQGYLEEQRKTGLSVFSTDENSVHSFTFISIGLIRR